MQSKPEYELEERTFQFAVKVRKLLFTLPKNSIALEDIKQLARSSGSVNANYTETNESLGDKDFLFHLKISRKETKESIYWLRLMKEYNDERFKDEFESLIDEARQLESIFSSITNKFK